jgi:hypothetical protein
LKADIQAAMQYSVPMSFVTQTLTLKSQKVHILKNDHRTPMGYRLAQEPELRVEERQGGSDA